MAQVDGEAGAEGADAGLEGSYGVQGSWVAAAVGHQDEGGCGAGVRSSWGGAGGVME